MKTKISFTKSYISEQIRDEIEELYKSNPKHEIFNLQKIKYGIGGDYSDSLDALIHEHCYIEAQDFKMYDVIYSDFLETNDKDTSIILDFIEHNIDIHYVYINKEFSKNNITCNFYVRHADMRYCSIDLNECI